jgi:superfamily II DNA or RNA helicase
MEGIEITEAFLAKIAGWEAMKHARALHAMGKVLSSNWTPPILKGVVQEGEISYRAGLVIKDAIDLENMCSCRESRQWGTICAHSVAVGLHHIGRNQPTAAVPAEKATTAPRSLATAPPASLSRKPAKRILRDEAGEPLKLSVILPPNFAESARRGRVTVCLEGQWRGGRCPLNSLPQGKAFQLEAADARLLDALEPLAQGEIPAMLPLTASQFTSVLPAMVGHGRIQFGRAASVTVQTTPWSPPLRATLMPGGEIRLEMPGGAAVAPLVLPGDSPWVMNGSVFQPMALASGSLALLRGPVVLSREKVPQFLSQEWPALQAAGAQAANFKLEDFSFEPWAPRFLLTLSGGLAQLQAQLQCAYGARIMTAGVTAKDETLWMPNPARPTAYSTRDVTAEQAALGRLLRAGFSHPDDQGRLRLAGQHSVLQFFARDYPALERAWEVTLESRLASSVDNNLERIEPRFEVVSSGVSWFDMELSYTTASGDSIPAAEIQRLLLSGQHHQRLKNGRFALIDTEAVGELQEVFHDCDPRQNGQRFRFSKAQAGFLTSTIEEHTGWKIAAPEGWRTQTAFNAAAAPPDLGNLDSVLRPYQKAGVAWVHFLRRQGFGGILADEMGLGKTLQALASLRASRTVEARPSLIVCPTTLVHNWVAEAARFTPELKTLAIEGPQRQDKFEQIGGCDLVVTSYALIRRDADFYRAIEFDTLVLDEAQHIKNRKTQNAQAVKAIRAAHRLVLTGTPMENSVADLWSIFDFLMPGYLGSAKDFHERYELPIAREKNVEAQARLSRRVRPFILRRVKSAVAPELPPKIEHVAYCEMTDDQTAVYKQILEASRREITEAVGAQGLEKSRMLVFTTLLRLRQICCDLRLLPLEEVKPETASAKMDLLEELLDEAIDGGHRVLVFSQFVKMLGLIRKKLEASEIDYCYLDGETRDRPAAIERFRSNQEVPIFLISLKAGGTGLNLSEADTVIHFDPWWNPAVEAQATDRAHRIGQTRVVTSYKLITRGTVEEKIMLLQNRKREMIEAALAGTGEAAAALSWDDIQELLR